MPAEDTGLHHLHLGDAEVAEDRLLDPGVHGPLAALRLGRRRDAQLAAVEAGDDLLDSLGDSRQRGPVVLAVRALDDVLELVGHFNTTTKASFLNRSTESRAVACDRYR